MIYVLGAQALERDGLADASGIQSRYLAIVVRDGLQRLESHIGSY
jgi:proline utilization trans-activator